jgi:hypothetical protein
VLLVPAEDLLEAPAYTLVTAQDGTVGQSLRLNTAVEWSPEQVLANQAPGTVTTVELENGVEVQPGQALYTVDLRPVAVGVGAVPAFRDLRVGDQGADVRQLQALLETLGYAVGEPDGRFGVAADSAVRAWQRGPGIEVDGVVRRGDVVFVPGLPARLALDPEIAVGKALAGGEPAVQVLPDEPSFTITLPENQARWCRRGCRWRSSSMRVTRGGPRLWSCDREKTALAQWPFWRPPMARPFVVTSVGRSRWGRRPCCPA